MNFNNLSLEEKFGQMFLIGLDTYEINDEIKSLIKDYKIGGVILYKKNYTSIDNMIEVINELKELNKNNKIPLFITIDQENGCVNRFPKDIVTIYGAKKQALCNDLNIINRINDITVYLLKSLGITMNFAPVLDIDRFDNNKSYSRRSYGTNKDEVIKNAIPFMKKMQENNIISVVKHFPGHGSTTADSHLYFPKIKNITRLEKEDLEPFKVAIDNGVDAIMVGHLKIKGYGKRPASLNKKIIDNLLINKYNYNGLIITDDLRMGRMQFKLNFKNNVKKAIDAGNNLVMIKYHKNDKNKLFKPLFKMLKYCDIDPELVNNNAKKIINYKIKYNVNDNLISNKLDIEKINKEINKVNSIIEKNIF